jgi:16S rRNA G966 N2-methylase RsmD
MKSNKSFFEERIGGSFHYQNYWMDRYAWKIRTKIFFKYINVYKKTVLDFGAGGGEWGMEILKKGADFVAGIEQSKSLAQNCLIPCQYGFKTLKNKYDLIIAITSLNFTLPKDRKKIILN